MIGFWLLLGVVTACLNGLARWWTVSRLRAEMGHSALWLTLSTLVVRLALVTALLVAALQQGIASGLAAFAGLWLSRWITVIWAQASGRSVSRRTTQSTAVGMGEQTKKGWKEL